MNVLSTIDLPTEGSILMQNVQIQKLSQAQAPIFGKITSALSFRNIDGDMSVRSAPGAGTEILITLPMKGENSYEAFIDR